MQTAATQTIFLIRINELEKRYAREREKVPELNNNAILCLLKKKNMKKMKNTHRKIS